MHSNTRFKTIIENFSMELRIDRALILADSGKFLKALQVLMHSELLPKHHEELDIVARLYVKTGQLEKAQICLKKAVSIAPHIKTYRAALSALELYIDRESKTRQAALKLGIFTVIVCTFCLTSLLAVKYGTPYLKNFFSNKSSSKNTDLLNTTNISLPKSTTPNQK